jgi:hypothetical protein
LPLLIIAQSKYITLKLKIKYYFKCQGKLRSRGTETNPAADSKPAKSSLPGSNSVIIRLTEMILKKSIEELKVRKKLAGA